MTRSAPSACVRGIFLSLAIALLQAAFGGIAVRAAETVDAAVGKPLQEAQALMKSGNFVEALARLKAADLVPEKTAYERFLVEDFRAYLYSRTGNHAGAAAAAEAALATGQVPDADRPQRLRMIASLHYQSKAYGKAIDYARQYQEAAGPDSEMQLLVAQSYYLLKDYNRTIPAIRALNRTVEQAGGAPEETWLQLLMSSAYHTGEDGVRREALMELVRLYPSPAYWTDLLDLVAAGLGSSGRMMLEVDRLRLAAGVLQTPPNFMEAAQLALIAGLPGEALAILDRGTAQGVLGKADDSREQRLLAAARTQASEDRTTLPSSAASPAEAAVLGEAWASYGKYDKAIALYSQALLTSFAEADVTRLHLGQAYLIQGNASDARKAFRTIEDPKLAQLARIWLVVASQRG